MLQPKNLLMKRGTLLGKELRVGRKVFAIIGSPDFTAGISVVFSECCLATVSDSETVFLCPLSPLAVAPQPITASHGGQHARRYQWKLPPTPRPTPAASLSTMGSGR
jgi:hypothetical protein